MANAQIHKTYANREIPLERKRMANSDTYQETIRYHSVDTGITAGRETVIVHHRIQLSLHANVGAMPVAFGNLYSMVGPSCWLVGGN